MPNKNYLKGRRKEYKTRDQLKAIGCSIAQRMAGSHSPIDVIGIDTEKRLIHLIQCKPDNMSENKKQEIIEQNKGLQGTFTVTFQVL